MTTDARAATSRLSAEANPPAAVTLSRAWSHRSDADTCAHVTTPALTMPPMSALAIIPAPMNATLSSLGVEAMVVGVLLPG